MIILLIKWPFLLSCVFWLLPCTKNINSDEKPRTDAENQSTPKRVFAFVLLPYWKYLHLFTLNISSWKKKEGSCRPGQLLHCCVNVHCGSVNHKLNLKLSFENMAIFSCWSWHRKREHWTLVVGQVTAKWSHMICSAVGALTDRNCSWFSSWAAKQQSGFRKKISLLMFN